MQPSHLPLLSRVLLHRLRQCPPGCDYTSFFVRQSALQDDCASQSVVPMLGWKCYRAQCWPFVKLYCRRERMASATTALPDVHLENKMLGALKILNLGIPFLIYGLAAPMWFHSMIRIPHRDIADMSNEADDAAAVGSRRAALAAADSGARDKSNVILSASAPPVGDAVDLIFLYDVGQYERGFAATNPGAEPSERDANSADKGIPKL